MKKLIALSSLLLVAAAPISAADEPGVTMAVQAFQPADGERLGPAQRTYFYSNAATEQEMVEFRKELIRGGARAVNLFLPANVIVCELPRTRDLSLQIDEAGVSRMEESVVARVSSPEARAMDWIRAAYASAERMAKVPADVMGTYADDDGPISDVVVLSPEEVEATQREMLRIMPDLASSADGTPRFVASSLQNAELMTGDILAHFIFPESNGGLEEETEDWSDADLTTAIQASINVMLDYQGQFASMNINFIFKHYPRLEIGYEAIKHNMSDDGLWVIACMRALGYGLDTANDITAVHLFNTQTKQQYRTDWAFTTFIACSRNQIDHKFENANYTAYSFLGGPYNINPFPAGGDPNSIGEDLVASKIYQHEIGHTFWTLDEYPGAPGPCGRRSGYLNYSNQNLTDTSSPGPPLRCVEEVECIMHSAARRPVGRPFCRWSLGHLGVIDDNGNRIPDVFEAWPEIEWAVAGPETIETNSTTIRFRGKAKAVPNDNPIQSGTRVDYTLPLADGFYRINNSPKIEIRPVDNRYDEIVEDFEIDLLDLPVGLTQIRAEIENSYGLTSSGRDGRKVFEKRIYFLGVNYRHLAVEPREGSMVITWDTIGETFGAVFGIWRKEGEDDRWESIATNVPLITDDNDAFPTYRYIDTRVKPGRDYSYYVEGAFTLVGGTPSSPDTLRYYPKSNIVKAPAMLPITSGIMSVAAPNPFLDQVAVSVEIPKSFSNGSTTGPSGTVVSFSQRTPTPVDVSVFDVQGKRVRQLNRSEQFADVMTLRWDGRNEFGASVPAGIYFIRAKAGDIIGVRKVVLIR